jgi:MoaA/NifB/PqqE/SkfB family radical SAM enzyme
LGFVVRIKTNGHAVRDRVARRIRDEVDPFLVEVSLHGATAETHDRQTRVPGSFRRLLANIDGMKRVGLRVKVNSVLTRWNEGEVERMLELFDELGVLFQIDPEVKPRDDGDKSPLTIEASAEGLARYREALESRSRHETQPGPAPAAKQKTLRSGTDKHCGAGSNALTIDPYGGVLPCVQWRVPVGNLHEQPLRSIWHASDALRDIRETTRAVREKLEGLGDTELALRFCPGAAHTHTGDPLALYPPFAKRIVESGRTPVRLTVL